mgnify:FL=1
MQVINREFGNLEREKIYEETPGPRSLRKALKFLEDEYDFDLELDVDFTLEGIDLEGSIVPTVNYVTDTSGKIAKEGVTYIQDRDPSTMVPDSGIGSPESPDSQWSKNQPQPGDPDYVPPALEDKYLSDPVSSLPARPKNDESQEQNAVRWQQYQELLRATFLVAGQVQNFEVLFGDESIPPEDRPPDAGAETNLSRMIDGLANFRGNVYDMASIIGAPSHDYEVIIDPSIGPSQRDRTVNRDGTPIEPEAPRRCPDGSEPQPVPTNREIEEMRAMCDSSGSPETWACQRLADMEHQVELGGCEAGPEQAAVEADAEEDLAALYGYPASYSLEEGEEEGDHPGSEKAEREEAAAAENEEASGDPKKPLPSPTASEAVKQDGLPSSILNFLKELNPEELLKNAGIAGTHIPEPVPKFAKADTEEVISNKYNAWIVLGRDRAHPTNANRLSGYGGKGHTQCGAIDIVVGRMAPKPKQVNSNDEELYVDPIFNVIPTGGELPTGAGGGPPGYVMDAARIYISQKTDIDSNFQLVDGKVGSSVSRSAIGMKADAIRIMGREGIKLVTRSDPYNSQGGAITAVRGIDLIADNREEKLQPMVLGNNLNNALKEIVTVLDTVVGSVQSMLNDQISLCSALATHIHVASGPAAPVSPSPALLPLALTLTVKKASVDSFSTVAEKWNMARLDLGYLKAGAPNSIRSTYNNVN